MYRLALVLVIIGTIEGSWFQQTASTNGCAVNPCKNGGVCVYDFLTQQQTCDCINGYSGPTCENSLCEENTCLNGGVCYTNGVSYFCSCQQGCYGDHCEVRAECPHEGYVSWITLHKQTSLCTPGSSTTLDTCGYGQMCCYDGISYHCIDKCFAKADGALDSCQNGQPWYYDHNHYTCHCHSGYDGYLCETCTSSARPCDSNPCSNYGTCINNGASYYCACHCGYYGKDCSHYNPCSSNPCVKGRCIIEQGQYKCLCEEGYTGDNCDVPPNPCSWNPCLHGGVCVATGTQFECQCVAPWTGTYCEVFGCPETTPNCPQSACVAEPCSVSTCDVYYSQCCNNYCNCSAVYYDCQGNVIDSDVCSPCEVNPCQNGGTCVAEYGDATCRCPPGFKGDYCQSGPCVPNPCQNGGSCQVDNCTPICNCIDGWTGPNCTIPPGPCFNNPCLNGGTCEVNNGIPECVCPEPYTGTYCECEDPCAINPCRNGGTCQFKEVCSFTCDCPPGFEGRRCQRRQNPCDPNPCRNGGTCVDAGDGTFECLCPPDFTGRRCGTPVPPDPCDPNPCLNGGTCLSDGSCLCPDTHIGNTCEELLGICQRNMTLCGVDTNQGECMTIPSDPGQFECRCKPGFSGIFCT